MQNPGDVRAAKYEGCLAVCKRGHVGRIRSSELILDGTVARRLYRGIHVEDGTPWQTLDPIFLRDSSGALCKRLDVLVKWAEQCH
jgi:hypothetical protein